MVEYDYFCFPALALPFSLLGVYRSNPLQKIFKPYSVLLPVLCCAVYLQDNARFNRQYADIMTIFALCLIFSKGRFCFCNGINAHYGDFWANLLPALNIINTDSILHKCGHFAFVLLCLSWIVTFKTSGKNHSKIDRAFKNNDEPSLSLLAPLPLINWTLNGTTKPVANSQTTFSFVAKSGEITHG